MKTKCLSNMETMRMEEELTKREPSPAESDFDPVFNKTGSEIAGRYENPVLLPSQGGEADLFLAKDKVTNNKVVVKIYRSSFKPKDDILKRLKGVKHTDIISLLDYGVWDGRFYEVMEFAAGGTLAEHLPFTEEFITAKIIPQVVNGLKYLHSLNIINRDLKPSNLFFRDAGHNDVVIGDFGISSLIREGMTSHDVTIKARTTEFAAPEVFSNVMGFEVDYYALGITLMYLLTGESPFKGLNEQMIMHIHTSRKIHPPRDCSGRFKNLLEGLLTKIRENRWGYGQVQRWLNGENVTVVSDQLGIPFFKYNLGEGKEARDFKALGRLLLDNPVLAKRHISQRLLYEVIKQHDQAMASKILDIQEKACSEDEAYLGIVYTLNPGLPYRLFR
ncbi:MAG: Serine/threonine-protein kinase PrkC [Pelotomaculum sp. PtaU1.Bin035]|nr:MAG: Serine/threonine-protein kinase PrkC [Pelotomaculum sp. PtaU1.Bin035]